MQLRRWSIVIFAGIAAVSALLIVQSRSSSNQDTNNEVSDVRRGAEIDASASKISPSSGSRVPQVNNEVTGMETKVDRSKIHFGDLEPLNIRLIPFSGKMPPRPIVVKDGYDSLVAQVRAGNASAGYVLYASLTSCSGAFMDEESLADGINHLYATRRIRSPDGAEMVVADDANVQDIETGFRNSFARCTGLSKEQVTDEPMQWLEQSATMGFLPAVDRLAWTLHENEDSIDDPDAITYLEKAWALGSTSTLTGLSEVYMRGSDSLSADPVRATAYLYLHNALFNGIYSDHRAGGVISRQIERNEAELNEALASLVPEQADPIPQIARDMLVENKKCCIDWGR